MNIPSIPQGAPFVQGPAAPPPAPDLNAYPKRSVCQHCDEVIQQKAKDAPWVVSYLRSDSPECPAAPNHDDGPMPGHAPGTVLHPPKR